MEKEQNNAYMGSVTVGEKGQIVIPKPVRDMLGIKPGDTLLILAKQDDGIGIPPPSVADKIRQQIFMANPCLKDSKES